MYPQLAARSVWLARLGATKAVPAVLSEEAEIYRRLAAARPGTFLPELADGLEALSDAFANLGRLQEALAPISESVKRASRAESAFGAVYTGLRAAATWAASRRVTSSRLIFHARKLRAP